MKRRHEKEKVVLREVYQKKLNTLVAHSHENPKTDLKGFPELVEQDKRFKTERNKMIMHRIDQIRAKHKLKMDAYRKELKRLQQRNNRTIALLDQATVVVLGRDVKKRMQSEG